MTDNEHRRHEHAFNGMTSAAALIARAVAGDTGGLWELVHEVAAGDDTKETLYALAEYAGVYVRALATVQHQPVDALVACVTDSVVDAIASEED